MRLFLVALVAAGLLGLGSPVFAGPADVGVLSSLLDDLDVWIGDEANGDKWRKYLRSPELREQLARGADADPAIVSRALQQYQSGANGLDMTRFVEVRAALAIWLGALQAQYGDDLPKRVWAARGDHVPVSRERLASVQGELRSAARSLEAAITGTTPFAQQWKAYLKWDLLSPHFSPEIQFTGKRLSELDQVLKRFRSNHPGLENPYFTRTASAIEVYRELAFWFALAERRDTRAIYAAYLKELEKQLVRNLETPSVESTRQVGKILGLMEDLGHSRPLVDQIRSEFSQPNILIKVSQGAINRLAQRPVHESRPVHDCILGAVVRGTATSTGQLSFHTVPAAEHIALDVRLVGHIDSRTTSYKKPVKISSRSDTSFVASKRLMISDERFLVMPSIARARTETHVRSIRKTGGRLGRQLVMQIARRKVAESKQQTEQIASRRAEQSVSAKFDRQLMEAIAEVRRKYDHQLRPPLVRIGMFPSQLLMASDVGGVEIQARLASYKQITTAQPPPAWPTRDDLTIQVHESAANNFFPTVLAGIGLRQDHEDGSPRLEGDVPAWLRNLSGKGTPEVAEPGLGVAGPDAAKRDNDFKPWAFVLNRDHPASISLDDQKLTVRIRIAELKTLEDGEEQIRKNWDFLITYRIVQAGHRMAIRRDGDIQAFPTGFDPQWYGDPRWDDKLTGEQVTVRSILEKNLNQRAASGEGFPEEIRVQPIRFPGSSGSGWTLVPQQFDCDNGWLTVGYRLQ